MDSMENIKHSLQFIEAPVELKPSNHNLCMNGKEDTNIRNALIDSNSENGINKSFTISEKANDKNNKNIDPKNNTYSKKSKDHCSLANSESKDINIYSNVKSEPPNSSRKREHRSPKTKKMSKKFCSKQLHNSNKSNEKSSDLTHEKVVALEAIQPKNIENTDLNDIYKGILSETIETFPKTQDARVKLQRLKRKQLEDLILEQMVATLIGDYKLGYQKDLCDRLEDSLEYATKKIAQLNREIKDLRKVTIRLEGEHYRRRQELVNPVVIKRSVGLQAEPCEIDQYYDAEMSSEETAYTDHISRNEHTNFINKNRPHQDDCENYSDMDDRNCYESLPDGSDTEEREDNFTQKMSPDKYKSGTKIPRPTLSAKQKKSSIVLTWNTPESTCQDIASFRLFSCQNEKVKAKKRWRIVGDVEPMELPMACTLTDFNPGKTYHFAVRAINFKGECGLMSKCETVFMS